MQIIIISPNKATHKHWTLTLKQLMLITIVLFALFFYAMSYVLQQLAPFQTKLYAMLDPSAQISLNEPKKQSTVTVEDEVPPFYAKRLGDLQAEAIRLKAITKQLADMTGFDLSQYALDGIPGQGGVEHSGSLLSDTGFGLQLTHLSDTFETQLHQLELMQTHLVMEDAIASTIPSRKPIGDGWLSSYYGDRIDPFSGKTTFHRGLDFASTEGSNIYAVADGMVSWTGRRNGYGQTVEIDHGNGYVTRYAHSKSLLVNMGDKVTKGQEIALIGSTGRSTGPHVHFELLREGQSIDPYSFVKN